MQIVWVAIFGLSGVFARYGVDLAVSKAPLRIPYGTLSINLAGSFLAGVLFVAGTEAGKIPPELRTGLMVGFLGGFTTFSAYSLQCANLIEKGQVLNGLLYWALSPALGIVASLAGLRIARFLWS